MAAAHGWQKLHCLPPVAERSRTPSPAAGGLRRAAAGQAQERSRGATPTFVRGGGSIPIVADIYALMRIPAVMMGYGLNDDGLHAPNERYSVEMFQRDIETAIVYLEELARLERQG